MIHARPVVAPRFLQEEPSPIDTTKTLEDLLEDLELMPLTHLHIQAKDKDIITQQNNVYWTQDLYLPQPIS